MALNTDNVTIPDKSGAKTALKSHLSNHPDFDQFKRDIPDPKTGGYPGRRLQSKADIVACANYLGVDIQQFVTDFESAQTNAGPADQSKTITDPDAPCSDKQRGYLKALVRKAKSDPAYQDSTGEFAHLIDLIRDLRRSARAFDSSLEDAGLPATRIEHWTLPADNMTKGEASLAISAYRILLGIDTAPAGDFEDDFDVDEFGNVIEPETDTDTDSDADDLEQQATELVNQQFAKFAAGDMDGFRRGFIELACKALEPKQIAPSQPQVITVKVDANGQEIKPEVCPTPVGVKSARELWPDLPKSAETYGFQCYDYVDPFAASVGFYDMRLLDANESLRIIARGIECGRHLWLAGEKGTGKTQFTRALAAATGRPFFRVQHFASMEALDLIGGFQLVGGESIWQDGLLVQALRTPGAVILLDEPTLSAMACGLYQTILDEGYLFIQATGERVPVSPGVTFFVADNSLGHGDMTGRYDGIAPINAAGGDRYLAKIEMHYLPPKAEADLLVKQTGIKPESAMAIAEYAKKIRDAVQNGDVEEPISFRRLLSLAETITGGVSTARALETTVFPYPRHEDDRETYRALANAHLPKDL